MPGIGEVRYHIVWCTKYRRKILNGIEEDLKNILEKVAKENKWYIIQMEIMPDHVHIFVKVDPKASPLRVVSQFKGYSSKKLRELFPYLKSRVPNLWTRSYYVGSVGDMSAEIVRNYILNQKKERQNSSEN